MACAPLRVWGRQGRYHQGENVERVRSTMRGRWAASQSGGPAGRVRARGLAVTAALVAGIAAVPSAAQAADDCANAAVRAQQQSQHLPNCMAYERVTPAAKGTQAPWLTAISEDGDSALFRMDAMLAGQESFEDPVYRSVRGADGWTTVGLVPSLEGPVRRARYTQDRMTPSAWSRDLSRVVIPTKFPFSPNDVGGATGVQTYTTEDVYLREPDGTFRWLVPDPTVPSAVTGQVGTYGASPDLERILLQSQRSFDPRVAANVTQPYLWTESGVKLVSVLPDGSVPAVAATSGAHAVSKDARTVAFTVATGPAAGVYVRFNADDPTEAYTRRVAEGPAGEACTKFELVRLSGDGRKVIFKCENALLPGAPADSNYLRDLDGGPGAVRLLVRGKVQLGNDDFSRILIQDQGEHLRIAGSLMLVRDGEPTEVATAVEYETFGGLQLAPAVSANGEYFVFETGTVFDLPGVDQGPSTTKQVFLLSAETGEVLCVSCRQDGAPTSGTGVITNDQGDLDISPMRAGTVVSPVINGGTVLFSTTTGLVPEDTNGKTDAYVWIDGRAVLLSSGRGVGSVASGASLDGTRLYFSSPDALAVDDRDGGQHDLYVARVNGGSLVTAPAATCEVNCQGPAAGRPGMPEIGTGNVLSTGNLAVVPERRRASMALSGARSVRGSATTLRVKVSAAGSVRVSGVGLRPTTQAFKRAGTYRMTVRLSAHGAQQQRRRGRMVTSVSARFTPSTEGASVTARRSVTFVAARKGGR